MPDPRAAPSRGVIHSAPHPQGPLPRAERRPAPPAPEPDLPGRLRQAIALRDGWLRTALCTDPADTVTAEAAVTGLYALLGMPPPRFEWVPSPAAGRAAAHGRPGFGPVRLRAAGGRDWPVAARVATLVAGLQARLEGHVKRPGGPAWILGAGSGRAVDRARPRPGWADLRAIPSPDLLAAGTCLGEVLRAAVRESLSATLRDAVQAPLRTSLPGPAGPSVLGWHGQHDAWWVGYYDVWRQAGLVTYPTADDRQLDLWAALARSAGWWWPGEGACIMAGRPVAIAAEPAPGAVHGELRLHCGDGPAIRFADGHELHVVHGTPVPAWAISDPTAERIRLEPNVEIRRTAIERIGWAAYIRDAGFRLVAASADPGNPGSVLRLYDPPDDPAQRRVRLLLAVNGSPEADGQHRQYGLGVPAAISDPVAAAGWTYGLNAGQYTQLARRT